MTFDMAQFTQVFFDETTEHLATIEEILLRLDVAEPGQEDLNAIFRAAHSIKGGAGTFGFGDMADFTHAMETLLDRLRKQELALRREMIDALLEAKDIIHGLLEAHQTGGEADHEREVQVRARLESFALGGADEGAAAEAVPVESAGTEAPAPVRRYRVEFKALPGDAGVTNLLAELRGIGTVSDLEEPAGQTARGGKRKRAMPWRLMLDTPATEQELHDLCGFVLSPDALNITVIDEARDGGDTDAYGFFDSGEGDAQDPVGYGFFEDIANLVTDDDPGYGFFDRPAGAAPAEEPVETGFGFFDDSPGAPASSSGVAQVESGAMAAVPGGSGPVPASGGGGRDAGPGRQASGRSGGGPAGGSADSSIRVSVEKVDQLINLVGELVITQSMLAQTVSKYEHLADESLTNGIAQLERNSRDLQEGKV
ncbi:MAG: hypothetical protein GC151_20340 [Betaproteobacteria bacterium]|nr:hypothetical protein [Betaproteobacteria bacterium]